MLPIKTRSVFKSRWIALLWAGGIIWAAADFVGGQPHRAAGADQGNAADSDAATSADVQAVANAIDGIK